MKIKPTASAFIILVVLFLGAIGISGCTKEGPQGKPGLDGIDGKDGAQTCGACHNMTEFLTAKIEQYDHSVHASGGNADRKDADCAWCHTSMGFRNYIADGSKGIIDNPTPVNCRTCHPIHESYTADDFVLRTKAPVTLMVGGIVYDYGTSNICANCHQARPVDPYPDLTGSGTVTIKSPYYGPHHATQVNMITSTGPIRIPGSMAYLNSAHTKMVTNGCITCHMSPATGVKAGGHQMSVKYTSSTGAAAYQYTGCFAADCHGTVTEINGLINPNREEITNLLEQLKDRLIEKGLLNEKDLVPSPITVSQLEAAALLNYKFVEGDHSLGAHNFRFTKALLVNTLEALQ
jgi:hypothetical protein